MRGFITKLVLPTVFMLCSSVILHSARWYDVNWLFRNVITIRGSSVTGTLTNYPVLIHFSNNALLQANARVDGTDILFTGSLGTNLMDFEIESYTNGTLYAWVRYPILTNGVNANLFIYYGKNSQTTSLANKTNVWDDNYQLVVHFNESATNDSSKYNNMGTNYGAGIPGLTNLLVGKGLRMDYSVGHSMRFSPDICNGQNYTVEFWYTPDFNPNTNHYQYLVTKGWYSTSGHRWATYPYGYLYNHFSINTSGVYSSVYQAMNAAFQPYNYSNIYYISYQHEYPTAGGGAITTSLLDGNPMTDSTDVYTNNPNTTSPFELGYNATVMYSLCYDEVRVSKVPRGTNYMKTVFTNLKYPQNFIWISNVEEPILQARLTVSTTNIHKHPALAGIAVYSNQTSELAGDITNSKYIFGDGTIVTRSGVGTSILPIEYSFSGYGTYTNWLVTSESSGLGASNSLIVNVIPYAYSTARFTVHPHEALLGSRVLFTDDSIKEYTLTNWEIDFGDGKSYTVRGNVGRREISYAYSRAGIYTASLRVVDERGVTNTNTYTIPITITDRGAIQLTNMTRRVYNRALDFPMGLKYPLSGKAEKVYVRILSISGYMIRDLGVFNGFTDTEVFISWDGNNWKGQGVAAGLYYVRFDVIGEGERLSSETEFFILK